MPAVALILGGGIATWQAMAQKSLREQAEADRRKAEAALKVATEAADRMLARVVEDQTVRANLQDAEAFAGDAVKLHEVLLQQSPSPELRARAASAYVWAGQARDKVGSHENASASMRRGIELLDKLRQEFPDHPDYEAELALAYRSLGNAFFSWARTERAEKAEDAEKAYRQSAEILEKLTDRSPAEYRGKLAETLDNLAFLLWYNEQLAEAERTFRRVLSLYKQHSEHLKTDPKASPKDRLSAIVDRGGALSNLATVLRDQGKLDESAKLLREAVGCQTEVLSVDPQNRIAHDYLYNHLWNLGETLVVQRDHVEAAKVADQLAQRFPRRMQAYHEAARVLIHCIRMADGPADAAHPPPNDAQLEAYRRRAHELLDRTASAEETSPEAVNRLSEFLLTCPVEEFRDIDRAETLARGLIDALPQRAWGHANLGVACYRRGR